MQELVLVSFGEAKSRQFFPPQRKIVEFFFVWEILVGGMWCRKLTWMKRLKIMHCANMLLIVCSCACACACGCVSVWACGCLCVGASLCLSEFEGKKDGEGGPLNKIKKEPENASLKGNWERERERERQTDRERVRDGHNIKECKTQ